jgi:sulfur relay (sulfurtransferase) complex TusBCD TusD component (DsrE family)
MKRIVFFILILTVIAGSLLLSQDNKDCGGFAVKAIKKEKIGIVISSNDAETVWNAFRLATYSQGEGDTVSVFLLGKGVEAPEIIHPEFDVKEKITSFLDKGGKILACGTCLELRKKTGKSNMCSVSTLSDLYDIIKKSDRLLTF